MNYIQPSTNRKFQVLVSAFILSLLSACSTVTSPITSGMSLSEQPLTGKFIWHDLLTDDTNSVREFYSALFGWKYEDTTLPSGPAPYTLIKSGGRYLGGIVTLADPEENVNFSRWVSYLSVTDVDKATAVTKQENGTVLIPARDIGGFGRAAIIQDPQAAVLGLARSKVGDPDDSYVLKPGDIIWHELITSDDEMATKFYQNLAGYDVKSVNRRGGKYHILKADGLKRAGIIQNPIPDLPPAWLVTFAVSDLVASTALVESAGGQVLLGPAEEFRESTVALVADPSGAMLLLQKWPL